MPKAKHLTKPNRTSKTLSNPTGAAAGKGAARDALEDVAFLMCQALSVLGHTGNDQDLLARTNLSASDLQRFPDDELANRATTILAEANARKTDLATFQVTKPTSTN